MDQALEDRIKVICNQEINSRLLVDEELCKTKHKGVATLEDKVKSLDARLWGLIVLALVQLGGLVAVLIK